MAISSAAVRYCISKGISSCVLNMKNWTYFTRPLSGPFFHTATLFQCSILSDVSNSVKQPNARLTASIASESPAGVPTGIGRAAFCTTLSPSCFPIVTCSCGLKEISAILSWSREFTLQSKRITELLGLAPLSKSGADLLYESHDSAPSGNTTSKSIFDFTFT